MFEQIHSSHIDLDRTMAAQGVRPKARSLGEAILVMAIEDYQSPDWDMRATARRFLYPRTVNDKARFAWVMALAPRINADWLRGELDFKRAEWDDKRAERVRCAKGWHTRRKRMVQ